MVDLIEYEKLRGEIDNRTQIAHALVVADLTALGVGLALADSLPDAVVGVSVASTFLWMLWVDVVAQTWKLAAYLTIELAPRFRGSDSAALGWETFVRRLDKGGDVARQMLRIADTSHRLPSIKSTAGGLYSSLLLGGTPLVLLVMSVSAVFEELTGGERLLHTVLLVGSLLLWFVALRVYRRFRAFRSAIDLAIENCAGHPRPPGNPSDDTSTDTEEHTPVDAERVP